MRITVNDYRIEGFCVHGMFSEERSVIAFSRFPNSDKWHTSSSMCIPSDISDAKRVIECYSAALNAINEWQILSPKVERIATLELALSEISALPGERLDEANHIAVAALNKDKG